MRIPAYKVYRAFRELDAFSDVQCRAYVALVRRRHWVAQSAAMLVGLALGAGVFIVLRFYLMNEVDVMEETWRPFKTNTMWFLAMTLGMTVAAPVLSGFVVVLLARDVGLRWGIRNHLGRSQCHGCGYSLLGLAVRDGAVMCPECGLVMELEKFGLTEGDLVAEIER